MICMNFLSISLINSNRFYVLAGRCRFSGPYRFGFRYDFANCPFICRRMREKFGGKCDGEKREVKEEKEMG